MSGAMLISNPDMAEHPMNGFTPRAAARPLFAEGVRLSKLEVVFGVGTPKASALSQFTAAGAVWSTTRRVNHTWESRRSQKWAPFTLLHPFGTTFMQGQP